MGQQLCAVLRDPEVRERLLEEGAAKAFTGMYLMPADAPASYAHTPEESMAGVAAARGVSPVEAYVDELVRTLPDAYQILARQGLYGDYFGFYMCDAILKLNGKGGQPVYTKLVGQDTGRCTPK